MHKKWMKKEKKKAFFVLNRDKLVEYGMYEKYKQHLVFG